MTAPVDQRQSRAQQVAAAIEDEILAERLPVGAHLARRVELMERFGISPTTMNEAMRILRTRGLIAVRPGNGGGIFVSSRPPQVRLGGIDLWFDASHTNPLDLFEARIHLEQGVNGVAFERADESDVRAMHEAVDHMRDAPTAHAFLESVIAFHRALVVAARLPVLDDMHQAVTTLLLASLSRAEFIADHEEKVGASIIVHHEIADAVETRDAAAFAEVMGRHHESLVRADDPHRSPTT
ncbi:FadR/GntR family transcriptional regulator [Nocardioides halotolerans]|uniref:FadR/GntR family transcriptional regulator n=1 Tax=Nocardioides halotolerans TaxID=433660 RepID=UPI0003FDADCA|nr:FCD domain-containing protein [Nocardioides halotolerans]